jgi:flavin reductase (DIM6/NTAB) family NADH-FMN oxidoreductase RutF
MSRIIPGEIPTKDLHQFLLGSVSPRPIAFVSTVDKDGNDNLAPYSFFNAFSSNPPVLVFSSNRRVATNTTKDTLHNIQETGECVINAVSYDIVRQMAITSVEFDAQESEFVKSGLTPIPSDFVKPKRVKESPVNMECKVREVVTLGQYGGAGHLIICEVLCMHIDDRVIVDGRIDPHKIDLMGRMGRAYYVRASGDAIHTIIQPVTKMVIGYNALPEVAKKSNQLTANDIGLLSGNFKLPTEEDIENLRSELSAAGQNMSEKHLTDLAQSFLAKDERFKALTCLFLI